MLDWLNKNTAAALLRELAAGQRALTHAALDELPDSKTIRHLRSVLVATGALASRDEHMIRLERWITTAIAGRDDHQERQLLHRYATWHALRRLRRRAAGQHITLGQAVTIQRHIRAAITLLDWLTARGLDLAAARQGDLDTWLVSDYATHRGEAGNFVRWARRQKLTSLDFAATRWDGPAGIIDTQARWRHARRLLHDNTIKPEDRVAGLLLLLYAQGPAATSRLTLDHVRQDGQHVRLRLGHEPIVLPEPLAALVLQLTATRRGHAALGDQGNSRWLSPAGSPASRPAPTARPGDCASSASAPARHAPPRCSASPPNFPQRCWPGSSASTSASLSPGSEPPPQTGPPTRPTTAAASTARRTSMKARKPGPS